jgi:hypothetical protein
VADGLPGGLTIWVGVGTGGNVRIGGGADVLALITGAGVSGGALPGATLGGTADTPTDGVAGCDPNSTTVIGRDVDPRAGAAPRPPAPIGALAAGGFTTGAPSIQPTVTANGRPREIMPKKMDLGESRTP